MDNHSKGAVAAGVDATVAWYFQEHPLRAGLMGSADPAHTRTLGDYSAEGFARRERGADEQLARLDALADTPADFEDEIDRDLVRSVLRRDLIRRERQPWRRDPSEYLNAASYGIFRPFLDRPRPEAELVDEAVEKLAQVPDVLAEGRRNVDPALAPRLYVERALGPARTGRAFLTSSLPGMVEDEKLRARLAAAAEPAAAAFDETAVYLADLLERAEGDWRIGADLYSRLLQEGELLSYGVEELHARGLAAYDQLDAEMRALSAALPGHSSDWRATMTELVEDHPATMAAMLAEYTAETERARRFTRERDLVTFAEGEDCRVLPQPEFLRPIAAVASYFAPPALTPSRVGTFNVPYTTDDATAEQILGRLKTNARVQMPTIAVHEAYPGHHWHLSWLAEQQRVVRNIFTTPYFTEGWGLYVETLMREQGYFTDPRHELAHLDMRIFRAARIIVDTALHCGDMTIEEAEVFMSTKASLTPETAKGEVSRYCAWPTQASSYLTGCLEIEAIRAEYLKQDKGTLKQFHDTIAGSGGLPLGLAKRVALR
jgi:uncharacterized protein (DUF885 family)